MWWHLLLPLLLLLFIVNTSVHHYAAVPIPANLGVGLVFSILWEGKGPGLLRQYVFDS